jgi:hypothetical protein
MLLTPIVLAVISIVWATTGGPPDPQVKMDVPHGYQAITDPYFGYVVPASWTENGVYSDSTADLYYNGPGGWAGENEAVVKSAPKPGQPAPAPIATFGLGAPTPYQLTDAHPVRVPGATFAYEYHITRNGKVDATTIDAWDASSQTQLWLVVDASPALTAMILGSLTTG